MKLPFFKRIGLFFVPISFPGWIIFFAGIAYLVYVFLDIDKGSHSVSDTLINFVFNLLIIAAVYSFLAFFTSKPISA